VGADGGNSEGRPDGGSGEFSWSVVCGSQE